MDMDELMEYLIVTDQVDEFFGLKNDDDEEQENEKENEDNKKRR